MSIASYSELQTAIVNWIKRENQISLDRVKEFIALAEPRIYAKMRVREMISIEPLSIASGSATIALPTRFKGARNIYVDASPKQKLVFVTDDIYIQDYINAVAGVPTVFTYEGNNIRLGPIPGADYTAYMTCFRGKSALSDSAPTHSMLSDYPNVFMYGALVEASAYLVGDERIPMWEAKFQQSIQEANDDFNKQSASGSTLETRPLGCIA